MIKHGEPPYLECSSKGDKRFSAFYAKIQREELAENNIWMPAEGKSIEELYQAYKIFEDGSTGLTWKEAKGRKPVNIEACRKFYSNLWEIYIKQNPELLEVLKQASGLSDMFGQEGHVCQATELWRIRNNGTL